VAAQAPQTAAQPPGRIVLEPLAVSADAVTAAFTGYDTGAPRELWLWRVVAGHTLRLARAASDADARIHAPQLPLPAAGIDVVVTPRGVYPGEPGASEPLRLARASAGGTSTPAQEAPVNLPRWRPPTAERSTGEESR